MAVKYSDEPKYDWVSLSKKKKKETEQSVLLVHYSWHFCQGIQTTTNNPMYLLNGYSYSV